MVKVTCYGSEITFNTREEAINYFMDGVFGCDPASSECARYLTIVSQLRAGHDVATDEDDSLFF